MPAPMFQVREEVQLVNAANEFGIVRSFRWNPQNEIFYYEIGFGGHVMNVPETALRKFVPDLSPFDELEGGTAAGAAAFRISMTQNRVARRPSRIAKSFSSARTQFYPHQFKPLLKLLEATERRLLIGDDVGLGKTIEAGYILTELEAGTALHHILVVVPARLRSKWQTELDQRFGQHFDLVPGVAIRDAFNGGRGPERFRWIASYESLRGQVEFLRNSALSIDCLIFDEAHRLRNPETLQHKLGTLLCDRSDAILMLTATPIQTSLNDLFHLAQLLFPNEYSDSQAFAAQMADNHALLRALRTLRTAGDGNNNRQLALQHLDVFLNSPSGRAFTGTAVVERARTLLQNDENITRSRLIEIQSTLGALSPLSHFFSRTRKVEAIPNTPERVPQWISIKLTPVEQTFYDRIIEICRARPGQLGWGAEQRLTMMYRAVASCIPAAMRTFRSELAEELEMEAEEPSEDQQSAEAQAEGNIPNDLLLEVRAAADLFAQCEGVDTKFNAMKDQLDALWNADLAAKRPRRKCIVFSYFRGTVEYLCDMLRTSNVSCVRVHGGIPATDRDGIVNSFLRDPAVQVLVTSDVSAEGVDLQVASVIFNYDLPWNPMVVEQRVGRIDRIGQEARVLTIANFVVAGSIEERILQRLFQRVRIFETSIGEMDALLGDSTPVEQLAQRALLGAVPPEEIEDHLRRAAEAFEHQRQAAMALDSRADELLAIDQALLDEVRAATGEHQIPSARNLLDFVNSALVGVEAEVVIPNIALETSMSVDLRGAFVRRRFMTLPNEGDRAALFMRRAEHQPVLLTFSREVAYRQPTAELIHATHPLVRWAANGQPLRAHAFSLRIPRCDALQPGAYVWLLSFLESSGVARALRMVGAFASVDQDALPVVSGPEVASVVGRILHEGVDVRLPWSGEQAPERVIRRLNVVREALDGYVFKHNTREREMHELREIAKVDRMQAGLRVSLERAQSLLQRYLNDGAANFAVRMQEAKVEHLRQRAAEAEKQLQPRPWEDALCTDIAVGYLLVGEVG